VISVFIGKAENGQVMTDDISELYTLQIIPTEFRKDPREAAYLAIEVQAIQLSGEKSLRAFFSNTAEFMNRLGQMVCRDAFRWREIENLLHQQGIVSVAGSDAELAFTEGELRKLGLEEADALLAA
jgi:hypothetical protein